jgi:hypothetical protein
MAQLRHVAITGFPDHGRPTTRTGWAKTYALQPLVAALFPFAMNGSGTGRTDINRRVDRKGNATNRALLADDRLGRRTQVGAPVKRDVKDILLGQLHLISGAKKGNAWRRLAIDASPLLGWTDQEETRLTCLVDGFKDKCFNRGLGSVLGKVRAAAGWGGECRDSRRDDEHFRWPQGSGHGVCRLREKIQDQVKLLHGRLYGISCDRANHSYTDMIYTSNS